jgi:protein TonB
MPYLRSLIGIALSLVATTALFLLMTALIESADNVLDDKPTQRIVDITMPDREIDTHLKQAKPDKPDDPEEPPPELEPQHDDFDVDLDAINMTPQTRMDLSLNVGAGFGSSDGEYLPIVKVAPMYPRRANSRGIQGYCTVEYTVTKTGATANIRAVDCKPIGYFEKVSIKAAHKFKYKPRVIDGEAIDVVGVRNRFTFELEK